MFGLKTRILAGLLLSAAVAIIAGGPAADAAQKKEEKPSPYKKKGDPTKKAVGTLPADAKLDAAKLAALIDKLIEKKLKDEKTTASDVCTDEEFFRRVTIDITGKIATAEQATAFLDSKDANKRTKLIDELLASKEYGKHMADVWQAMLLPRDSDAVRFRQYTVNMTTWLEKQFNDNPGWDKTVKELMTSTGDVSKEGPAVYWVINSTPDKMTDNVTRMFMGVQLQCAQCHNHPFTDYKQNEYWHMAAFFMKVGPEGNAKAAAKAKTGVLIGEKGKLNKKKLGPDAKVLPPKFFQDSAPTVKNSDALRPLLSDWMATKKNPFFSKAMANRMWGHFMGRGLVAPVDDMHDANPASHPELLMDLAAQFAANDFDVKYLVRAICNSTTYQRSSKVKGNNNEAGPELFARMAVKPLTPGQLWDSVQVLVGANTDRPRAQAKGGARNPGTPRLQFVLSFGIEDGADPTEFQTGIPQALRLMNAQQMNNAGLLAPILKNSKTQNESIEKLYLTVLNRRPTSEEVEKVNKYITKSKATQREAFSGVLWAMMNSSEFALNR